MRRPPTSFASWVSAELATLMLAVTAGMVCGGAVFAAEREAATFSYLDSLPAYRSQICAGKLIAGLGLALVQIALLVALAAALNMVSSLGRPWLSRSMPFSPSCGACSARLRLEQRSARSVSRFPSHR